MNRRQTTIQRVDKARTLYFSSVSGLTDKELAEALGISQQAANALRHDLGAKRLIGNRYELELTADLEELAFSIINS